MCASFPVVLVWLTPQSTPPKPYRLQTRGWRCLAHHRVRRTGAEFQEDPPQRCRTFSYPFLGEVVARGLTPNQVEQKIVEGLKQGYLVDPKVSLSQIEYRPFYINGEVQKPGSYPFQPGLTLEKAIALGGGLTERASMKRVTILRGVGGPPVIDDISRTTVISPGDTISIAQGFF